mgnify:CR=1 FL=1
MFVPGKLELFRGALAKAYATPPEQVTLHRFDVIDVSAKITKAAQADAMSCVPAEDSTSMAPDVEVQNFIICTIEEAVYISTEFEASRYIKAAALRGLGFTLIELGNLDEAEVALRKSLILEPESQLAQGELLYIEQLRLGR